MMKEFSEIEIPIPEEETDNKPLCDNTDDSISSQAENNLNNGDDIYALI